MPPRRLTSSGAIAGLVGAAASLGVLLTGPVPLGAQAGAPTGVRAFVGATVIDPGSSQVIADATIVVRDGRIAAIGPRAAVRVPDGVTPVSLSGTFVTPGFISAHAHVSNVNGLRPRAYTPENTIRQLGVFARYGITTVWSLGGEQAPAFELRDAQSTGSLDRARIYVAGPVITAETPEEGRAAVARVAATRPDVIKIRIDTNLGTATAMTPPVYRAIIEEAHARNLRVAVHIFYLDDAKAALKAGADIIAHSVRDRDIDDEFLSLMKARQVPYIPTFTREISTFVYESTPAFFSDPFFTREADADVLAQLRQPDRQAAMRASTSAQAYKAGLDVAKRNLKRAADAGVLVAMGTDSGASPERFSGFFEHVEMTMMVEAGLTPAQVLRAATSDAARTMRVPGIGSLRPGDWADFVVLARDPRSNIDNTRAISAVYVAGNAIKR